MKRYKEKSDPTAQMHFFLVTLEKKNRWDGPPFTAELPGRTVRYLLLLPLFFARCCKATLVSICVSASLTPGGTSKESPLQMPPPSTL